jgi:hypothetical protein
MKLTKVKVEKVYGAGRADLSGYCVAVIGGLEGVGDE